MAGGYVNNNNNNNNNNNSNNSNNIDEMMMMMCLYCLSHKNTYYLTLGSAHVDEKVGGAFPHSFIASCARYVTEALTTSTYFLLNEFLVPTLVSYGPRRQTP